jgi:hypothetical protein
MLSMVSSHADVFWNRASGACHLYKQIPHAGKPTVLVNNNMLTWGRGVALNVEHAAGIVVKFTMVQHYLKTG